MNVAKETKTASFFAEREGKHAAGLFM